LVPPQSEKKKRRDLRKKPGQDDRSLASNAEKKGDYHSINLGRGDKKVIAGKYKEDHCSLK